MKSTEKFSKTIEHYHQYRPSYPKEMIDFLLAEKILGEDKVVADIGSGTGIFTQQLLISGPKVFAIEPNDAMRKCAEQRLKSYSNFISVNASAEKTTLLDNSIDVISVATAFHWFNRDVCSQEFKRILRDDGYLLLFWNLRLPELSPILQDYENLLTTYCPEYKGIPTQQVAERAILGFFSNNSGKIYQFKNEKKFDLDGLIGRLLSTSYSLTPEQANYNKMIARVTEIFNQHQKDGQVTFPYTTKLYMGRL